MKKRFNLIEEYKESWNYIKSSKVFIFVIIGIFLGFVLIGFFVPAPETLGEQILNFIQELLFKTSELSGVEMIRFILLNNLQSSFLSMVLGIALGIFPIMTAIANGYLLGFVSNLSVQEGGFSTLLMLLPHGIFEIPAIFLSLGIGLRLGCLIFRKKEYKRFRLHAFSALKVFVLIVVPLLIIAAIIEGVLISAG